MNKDAKNTNAIPLRFRITERVTLTLTLIPIIIMLLDFCFSWTGLSAYAYLYMSACGLALYLTTKAVKRSWIAEAQQVEP